jgi:secreted PhoX family phosphatase
MTELTDRPVDVVEHDADDLSTNPSTAASFAEVAHARLSRRSVLRGGMLAAAGFMTTKLYADTPAAYAAPKAQPAAGGSGLLGFRPIPLSTADEVVVPRGYTAAPFIPWGTPLHPSGPGFVPGSPDLIGTGNTAADQEQQVGMHHDGMHFFPLGKDKQASRHGLLVLNHEYTDEHYLHTGTTTRPTREQYTADMVRKSQAAHGVTVVEVREDKPGRWKVMPSKRNRRITANTPMTFAGAAAGSRALDTGAPANGRTPVGTINNCAHGVTPWGTYLTCEENFNGYFRVDQGSYTAEQQQLLSRYGVGGDRYSWTTHDPRFVVTPAQPNEPNRFGWVVEIDPFSASSTPVKRTALGRVKHEGAFVHVADSGQVVVYMGDDQVNEYAYKYVSARPWRDMVSRGQSPLDEGTLYVAVFHEDGSGNWMPLVHGRGPLTAANGFADQGDVLVKTRLAADALGATRMDRPEWTTVDATTGMVYLTLTNNTSAAKQENAANPRTPNPWGHIVRWQEDGNDHTATTFAWDLFLLAGQGRETGDGSTIDSEDAFGSPDGLWADPAGRLWIQTDGRQPQSANNQMLAADPTVVDADGRPEVRRFFTGVTGCEVTGVITTPDDRTMFVNIQHPGGSSTWPQNDGLSTPRSATVIVVKDDGGVIGS